jgi:hypothetical protein
LTEPPVGDLLFDVLEREPQIRGCLIPTIWIFPQAAENDSLDVAKKWFTSELARRRGLFTNNRG